MHLLDHEKSAGKGPDSKLGRDWALVDRICELISVRQYSPYAILEHFRAKGWPSQTRICEKTLYTYIAAGDITGISEKDLLLKGKRRKPRGRPPGTQGQRMLPGALIPGLKHNQRLVGGRPLGDGYGL